MAAEIQNSYLAQPCLLNYGISEYFYGATRVLIDNK